jgi:hypothetical protein
MASANCRLYSVCAMAARVRFLWLTIRLPSRLTQQKSSVSYSDPLCLAWAQAHYDALQYQGLSLGQLSRRKLLTTSSDKIVAIKALTWLRSKPFGAYWANSIYPHLK